MMIPLLTFVVLFAGIYGAYWLFVVRPEDAAVGVVRRRLKADRLRTAVQRTRLLKEIRSLSALGPLDALLKRAQSRSEGLAKLIEQSGVNMTVGTLVLGSGTLGLLALVLVYDQAAPALSRVPNGALAAAAVAIAAGIGVSIVPMNVLGYMRTLRVRKFEEQFPEALDLLSRALKAGHAFTTGIDMVASEMPKPVGPEFRTLYEQQNYGMAMDDALKAFAHRIPVLDARFFVTAVLIQRQSGGNLSEVLDNLASVIRERFRVKRQMRVISAHGRITGWILVCLPPTLGVVLMSVNRNHRETMFGDPLGIQMIIGAIVLQIVGTLIMRKIVNVEY
jgi:tight adherence protein B